MADKKPTPKKVGAKSGATTQRALATSSTFAGGFDKKTWALALLVVVVTGVVFSGVTKLQWTNWDDDEYVYENDMVMSGDYKAIFTTPVNNNYNPLPVAMHAWEWKQVAAEKNLADKAGFFHVNNLWMHLLCTFLVFWLMKMLGLQPVWAMAAALLFGIHPMRVESVAWITERKDVMFGMFYVGALITYLKYIDSKKILWIVFTAVLFTLSLLSKIQAVSLPLSMLAIDWYRERDWNWKMLLEKVPFFLGSAIIGYVGVKFLQAGETLDVDQSFGLIQRVPLGLTAYMVYVIKSIIPYETCTFYPYPKAIEAIYYAGTVGALAVMAGAFLLRKISRETTFGLAFFTVNIMFLLQILGAGSAFMADRFSYIAYIGLFFAMAMVAQRVAARNKMMMPVVASALGLLVLVGAFLSWRYIPAWENSDTLWSDVIQKYPRKVVLAYVNRGQYLRRDSQVRLKGESDEAYKVRRQTLVDRAFADFNVAVELQPKYHLGYLNRGNIYFDRGENDAALADYSKVIEIFSPLDTIGRIDPAIPGALSNRGAIYSRKGMRAEALGDFRLALKFNPKDKNTWNNRAVTFFDMGDYNNAIKDFTEFLKFEPASGGVMNARGVCYLRLGKFPEAIKDFSAAIQNSPNDPTFYGNRAYANGGLGNKAAAKADVAKAQSLGLNMDPVFVAGLQ
jgi:protein O-mannosyl-transferase